MVDDFKIERTKSSAETTGQYVGQTKDNKFLEDLKNFI
jgi:hypothetical protein